MLWGAGSSSWLSCSQLLGPCLLPPGSPNCILASSLSFTVICNPNLNHLCSFLLNICSFLPGCLKPGWITAGTVCISFPSAYNRRAMNVPGSGRRGTPKRALLCSPVQRPGPLCPCNEGPDSYPRLGWRPFSPPSEPERLCCSCAPPFLFRKVTLEKSPLVHLVFNISSNVFLPFWPHWPPTAPPPRGLNPTRHRDRVYAITTVLQTRIHHLNQPATLE